MAAEASMPKRRRGPKPIAPAARRTHTVSSRLNSAELAWLDAARDATGRQRGEYMREATLGKLPRRVPPINEKAWRELAHAAANLNQIAHSLNAGESAALKMEELQASLDAFRLALTGAVLDEETEEET